MVNALNNYTRYSTMLTANTVFGNLFMDKTTKKVAYYNINVTVCDWAMSLAIFTQRTLSNLYTMV